MENLRYKKRDIVRGMVIISILAVGAFTSRPIITFAQDSTAEIVNEVIKTASTASEIVETESEGAANETAAVNERAADKNATGEADTEENRGLVLSAQDELNVLGESVELDVEPAHLCEMETFSQKVTRGEKVTFTFSIFTGHPQEIIKNTYFLGELPTGTTGEITGAASKTGKKYDIVFNTTAFAQRGSFNVPVFYKETDNDMKTSLTMCQLNLIVE